MIGFLHVELFVFERSVVEQAYEFLSKAGDKGYEAVALFVGSIQENRATVTDLILPEQKSYKLETGLLYAVGGEELHRINVWLYKNKLKILAQIHSHPREAYHSETDDEFPIMATVGGLSIVVPNFAMDELSHLHWAYYRLSDTATWDELSEDVINKLILIK